ncbi:hypothetical protein ACFYOA_00270 [Streptomyces iakyrus]|uniref:hypothetical protein n=1 Tax=Streptomyces iakyrus TaxID=68219 RepID=UPI0036CD6A1B
MDRHPLRLTAPVMQHVFGGRAIAERLGRGGLPDGPVAETREVSDVEGDASTVLDAPPPGAPCGSPVHLHADDATARRLEGEPSGKTEAWHVLDAAPGATALVGVRSGVDRDTLHRALPAQDFDAVMRRLPVRAG